MTDVTRRGFVGGTKNGSNFLTFFGVSPSSTTPATPILSAPFKLTLAASYSSPPSGLQCQTSNRLDTLDGRLEHAVAAKDPNHANHMQYWTAHAVSGGLGVEARWYEVDVSAIINGTGGPALTQSGTADASHSNAPAAFAWKTCAPMPRRVWTLFRWACSHILRMRLT